MNERDIRRALRDSLDAVGHFMRGTHTDEDLFPIVNALCMVISDRIETSYNAESSEN